MLSIIAKYSPSQWRQTRNQMNATNTKLESNQNTAMQLNGLNISKQRINGQFTVKLIDRLRLPTIIASIGDIITLVNNIELRDYTTETAAQLFIHRNVIFNR